MSISKSNLNHPSIHHPTHKALYESHPQGAQIIISVIVSIKYTQLDKTSKMVFRTGLGNKVQIFHQKQC